MKVIDLTHLIYSDMPVFPGDEKPYFEKVSTLESDGFRESKIMMNSHTGTHIDAPAHMLGKSQYLDNIHIEHFIGKAIILDFSHIDKSMASESQLKDYIDKYIIDVNLLKVYKENIEKAEFIIIKTGWSKYWGEEKYYKNFPCLSEEAAQWLSQFTLKGVGVDTISIDDMESTAFPVHKALLKKNIIIIENLTNLEEVSKEQFILSVMPLKNKYADGSPVRAVALEEI